MDNTLIKTDKTKITLPVSLYDTLCTVVCFFMSQASVVGNINPFGIAFLASCTMRQGYTYCFFAFCIGTLLSFGNVNAFKYIISAFLISAVLKILKINTNTLKKASLSASILLFVSVLYLTFGGFLLYDFMLCLIEALLCFTAVYILDGAIPLAISCKSRSYLSAQEMLSVVCLFSLTVLGLNAIPPIIGIKISNVASILLILMLNLKGEMMTGASIGVIFGFIASTGTYNTGAIVGAYAFASLLCGLFKKYARFGVILGFTLANAIITAFINSSTEVLINVYETIIASVIFLVMPRKVVDYFAEFPQKTVRCQPMPYSSKDRMQYMVQTRLKEMSAAFSKNYKLMNVGDVHSAKLKPYIDVVAEQACSECGGRFRCWRSNPVKTYGYFNNIFGFLEEYGHISKVQMPDEFKKMCSHPDAVLKSLNNVYKQYKTDKICTQKLVEARLLMAEQMNCISKSIDTLANKISLYLDTGLESLIRTEIDKAGIYPDDITALSDRGDYFVCEVAFKQTGYKKGNEFKISKIIGDAVDMNMQYNGTKYQDEYAVLCFSPRENYTVSVGASSLIKSGEKVCGDSFCASTNANCYTQILSDGMGRGELAHNLSSYVCNMIKSFSESGFDADTCIKTANSSLIFKSDTDEFATIDMLSVNLNDGKVSIYKNCACPTYVKMNGRVEKIECSSLPAGVISKSVSEKTELDIPDNALVLTVSDGVYPKAEKDDWIIDELLNINSQNPQIVANSITKKVREKYCGNIEDDVTVIATSVWKN